MSHLVENKYPYDKLDTEYEKHRIAKLVADKFSKIPPNVLQKWNIKPIHDELSKIKFPVTVTFREVLHLLCSLEKFTVSNEEIRFYKSLMQQYGAIYLEMLNDVEERLKEVEILLQKELQCVQSELYAHHLCRLHFRTKRNIPRTEEAIRNEEFWKHSPYKSYVALREELEKSSADILDLKIEIETEHNFFNNVLYKLYFLKNEEQMQVYKNMFIKLSNSDSFIRKWWAIYKTKLLSNDLIYHVCNDDDLFKRVKIKLNR